MNILVLTSVYPQPDDDDVVTPTVQYFCREWVKFEHRVIVIHNSSCFPSIFYLIPDRIKKKMSSKLGHSFPNVESRNFLIRDDYGVQVYRFPMVKVIPYSKFSVNVLRTQADKIQRVLEENEFVPDVIINHWVNPQIDLMRILRKKYVARTSLVFHNDCSEKIKNKFALQDVSEVFDVIGCRNDDFADYVQSCINLNDKPFVCRSGIPDELAAEQEHLLSLGFLLKRNKEFLYVGRLVEYKKVDIIIEALAKANPDKDFIFNIVGEGAERKKLQNTAYKLGVNDNVRFHGQIPREEVFELMKKCFCFTMVSEKETFGMVYIEAMLAGCVTVASIGSGVDGVIIDGENGFLVSEGNVDELTELYVKLNMMTDNETEVLRRRAIETALRFRDSAVAQEYLNYVLQ